jgi:RNA polymerase sigma factor (sigma-70 family)
MPGPGSVSLLLSDLKVGHEPALTELHRRFWPMLVRMARKRLKGVPGRFADEEDVAQQAFLAFVQAVRNGKLPKLDNRYDFMAVITHIVACKAVNQIEHEVGTKKRGAGKVRGESVFLGAAGQDSSMLGIGAVAQRQPTPADEAALEDAYNHLLDVLPADLRPFAERFLAGVEQREIAAELQRVERTVERKIRRIRDIWRRDAQIALA